MTRFGKTLEQAGIMQRWVADKTGITAVAINRYVHGSREPGVRNAIKIAKVLGMKVEDLWDEEGSEEDEQDD